MFVCVYFVFSANTVCSMCGKTSILYSIAIVINEGEVDLPTILRWEMSG